MNRRTSPRSGSPQHPHPSPRRRVQLEGRPPSHQTIRHRRIGFAVLSGLVVAAAAGIAAGDDDRPRPALEIDGTSVTPAASDSAGSDPAAGERGSDRRSGGLDQRVPLEELPDILIGDAALRGRIALSTMTEVGDHYEVRLDGGRRARLTLDPTLQKQAQRILTLSRAPMAAIVAMAPDGRILALAGRKHGPPTDDGAYDLATKVWAPAASVFKLVTAAALLQAGVGASSPVCFHGGLREVAASNLEDDPRRDRQCQDLTFAVAESQNAIVAKLAHKFLDRGKLSAAASAFGLGRAASFSLDCEASRVSVPDDALEQARFAAGFWSSELSAMDGAILASVVANRGMRLTPRIVAEVVEKDGKRRRVVAVPGERAIPARVASTIAEMMVQTTERGTAYRAFHQRRGGAVLRGIKVAGKTGSLDRDAPSYMGFSWFVGFAPSDRPEVIVSVVLGNQEKWWLKGHTAARMLLEVAMAHRPARAD
ncbi:MAG TPA: penicillin-binding transpeptidase domain-containing protein [Kofleriaceae bacterium]|nr:penicillin-binding transpeptidase domain-containing protein [Kofleriaceae bacterium]